MGSGKRQAARLAARQAAKVVSRALERGRWVLWGGLEGSTWDRCGRCWIALWWMSRQHDPSQPHPSPSPSSPSTTTIHDLPLDTIGYIISIAYPRTSALPGESRARQDFLLDTCLVCQDWTPFAQAELWTVVTLNTTETLNQFAAARPGRYPVEVLSLSLPARMSTDEAAGSGEAILRDVWGVHTLELFSGNVDASLLCGSGFTDLKILNIQSIRDTSSTPLVLPFNLSELKFCGSGTNDRLLHALSQQAHITFLRVWAFGTALELLLPLAPRLVTLQGRVSTDLDDYLPACTRLEHLILYADGIPGIERLTSSLKSLKIVRFEEWSIELLLDLLNADPIALEALECLTIHACDPGHGYLTDEGALERVESMEGWFEIEEVCRQKPFKLVITGEG